MEPWSRRLGKWRKQILKSNLPSFIRHCDYRFALDYNELFFALALTIIIVCQLLPNKNFKSNKACSDANCEAATKLKIVFNVHTCYRINDFAAVKI